MQESAVELENSISEEIEQIRTDMQDGFTDTIDTVD